MKSYFILALGLLLPLTSWAYVPNQSMRPGASIGAEWIYFSPNSETIYYATLFKNDGEVNRANDELLADRLDHYRSGYRVFGSYGFCQCDSFIEITWTDLTASHSTNETGFINPVILFLVDSIEWTRKFHYSAVDAVAGLGLFTNCYLDVTAFAGLHWARLRSKDDVSGVNHGLSENGIGTTKSDFKGIGPEIGLNIESLIGCGFSLQASATGAILIGEPETNVTTTSFVSGIARTIEFTSDAPWRMVPYGDIRVGGVYDFSFCCGGFGTRVFGDSLRGSLEVGYEALVYSNALVDIVVADFRHFRHVTMHGPFVSLAFHF